MWKGLVGQPYLEVSFPFLFARLKCDAFISLLSVYLFLLLLFSSAIDPSLDPHW
jgi:hypothetical protein